VIPRLAQANRIHNEAASRLLMSPSIISTTHNMQMKDHLNNITNTPHLSIYTQEPPLMSLRHRQVSKLFFLFTSLTNNTRNHNDILVRKKIEKITKLMLCHRAVWRPRARFMSFDVSLHYDRSALSTTFLRMQLDYMPPCILYVTFFLIFRWRLPFNTTAAAQTVAALFYPSFLVYIRIVVRHFTNSSTVCV
jgi:hypothetical protein